MNIIEISNQLKDVPDQFLMKEVQAPSGAYPSYLVISELTRRKRMRESALKEAPQTTVAQDLADPGREQRQMAMAQAAQQMAAPSLNAGLAAAPQAMESLAAQDAMGTTPPEMMMPAQGMAAGGMVSFKQGGDVVRAYDGLPEYMYDSTQGESSIRGIVPRLGGLMGQALDVFKPTQESIGAEERREEALRKREDARERAMSSILSGKERAPEIAPAAPSE